MAIDLRRGIVGSCYHEALKMSLAKTFRKLTNTASRAATVATRMSVNPVYQLTDRAANAVAPGTSRKVNAITGEIINPLSQTNTGIVKATATTINPVKQLANLTKVGVNLAKSGNVKTTEKKVIPNRAAYADSASTAAANQSKARQAAEKPVIPDRASYSANASATESIRQRAINQNKESAKGQGDAWNNASTAAAANQAVNSKDSQTPAADAANINTMYPDQAELLRIYADLARGGTMKQNLPEVVVESDYKKYFIFGGIVLLGIIFWKKIK